jgi:hypothetical protein
MSLSPELQARYTSEVDVDWRHAFVIWHPLGGVRYLIDHTEEFTGNVDDARWNETPDGKWNWMPASGSGTTPQLFVPVPVQMTLPKRDSSGRSEMSLTWCGIQKEVDQFLCAAIGTGDRPGGIYPVICRYSVFILGDPNPQIDPWVEFRLTNIAVTEQAVTATASSADVLNQKFPTEVYRLSHFPGLRRR